MYLLPVTTYYDYLKASKKWTARTGGTLLLGAVLSSAQIQKPNMAKLSIDTAVEVKVDGLTRSIRTNEADPYEILRKAKVALGPSDIIKTDGKTIEVIRVEERLELKDSRLSFDAETKVDYSLAPGTSRVIAKGEPGIKRTIFRVIIAGGAEVGREILNTEIVQQPVKRIIRTNPVQVSRGTSSLPLNLKVSKEIVMEATAYTYTGHNTATGVPPRRGLVAVDPRLIPLGTKLYIEGYGLAQAADTGGAIKGAKIDVFFTTLKECLNWGRRRVKVYVLKT